MSDVVTAAVKALNEKLNGAGLDGSAKMVIEGEGALRIDESGASAGDGEADCVLTADAGTFEGMLRGEINPTSAFMTGRLRIEGDMALAMKLGALLA